MKSCVGYIIHEAPPPSRISHIGYPNHSLLCHEEAFKNFIEFYLQVLGIAPELLRDSVPGP